MSLFMLFGDTPSLGYSDRGILRWDLKEKELGLASILFRPNRHDLVGIHFVLFSFLMSANAYLFHDE